MVSARIRPSRILISVLSAFLYVPVAGQTVQTLPEHEGIRLASRQEGEAVVEAAWELRRGFDPKPDCSHFVNAVYAQAGLDYEYANSSDVYDGIDSFRQIEKPQPGDLVVWPGHIGIVIDPDEHSFYSSVSSGFAIEDYRSKYWTSRGEPRFYRYVIDEVHHARLAAHLKASQHTPPSGGRPLSERDTEFDVNANNHSSEGTQIATMGVGDAEVSEVIFVTSHRKPTNAEVRAAVLQLAATHNERVLHHRPMVLPNQAIVVADQVVVAGVKIHNHSGWAELEVMETNSGQDGPKPGERWRVSLRHEERGWVLLAPENRVYLRRDLAIRALVDQLAIMSRTPANEREIKKLVKALDALLSREGPGQSASLE
jgi:hypothetical protein